MTTSSADRLRAIHAAPKGPTTGAFFDFDGTLIDGYSASYFYRRRIRDAELGPRELLHTLAAVIRGIDTTEEFERLLALTLQAWTGYEVERLTELGEELFSSEIAGRLHTEVWELVEAHRECGHHLVLASSATRFQAGPMARELAFRDLICTEIESVDGRLTGRVAGKATWGEGKAEATRALAALRDIDIRASFAYSNGAEDIPFLQAVGNPVAVDPADALRSAADEHGWPIFEVAEHRGSVLSSVKDITRTAALYGGVAGAVGVGLGIGALHRSRRKALDMAFSLASDVGLGLAGIELEVIGAENLWAARPAVFIFNHQSKLDVLIMMKLLRERFTGVVKREVADIPGWGQFFRFADVAFVERGNTEAAKRALAPAVAAIREQGISLVISPEGTRSLTPRLGTFKKGPFHIAMQAEVPIVPVVLRNAGDIMWRSAQTVRSGKLEVCVLPPVDTSDWTPSTLDDHVIALRDHIAWTLTHWPQEH